MTVLFARHNFRAAALVLASMLAACGEAPKQAAPPPPTVTIANPIQKKVNDFDEYVGRFVAVDSVDVRARVSGYLEKVHFTDGQNVKEGDLLFTIDRRPFQNAVGAHPRLHDDPRRLPRLSRL